MTARKQTLKKTMLFATAFELYDKLLHIYTTQYDKLSKPQKKKINVLNRPTNLALDLHLDEDDLSPIPLVQDDEVKSEPEETIAERVILNPQKRKNTGTGLKFFIPNKILTRLPILLVQIKAGNYSYQLKNEIRQILYLLYQDNRITKNIYNNLIKSL